MIAYPPQKPPTIRQQFEAWKAHMETVPDLMLEHLRGSGLVCPRCGMEMTVRRGRRSGRYMVFHPACDDMGGFAWWGDTREEAIAEFQRFSESEVKSCAATFQKDLAREAASALSLPCPSAGDCAPSEVGSLTPPSATFHGMEFSVEGLSEEAVNSLLTMKEEAPK